MIRDYDVREPISLSGLAQSNEEFVASIISHRNTEWVQIKPSDKSHKTVIRFVGTMSDYNAAIDANRLVIGELVWI